MIFIKTDELGVVTFQHNFPFDEKVGLNKTEEELLKEGHLVDIPMQLKNLAGKTQVLHYNQSDNTCFWEYEDIVVPKDSVQEQINSLGQTVAQEKIKNMQKDAVISNLGQELSKAKLDIMKLQGGNR